MSFNPDIPGAEVISSPKFWPGRLDNWPTMGVVQHYTGGGNGRALAKWMASDGKVSAHILICRDGHIIQQVRFADRAWHAGEKMNRGRWKGLPQPTNVNHFTIGIENSNYGPLVGALHGEFYTRSGRPYKGPQPVRALDHRGVDRWWEPYTEKLVASNIAVLKIIARRCPGLTGDDVQFHSQVSPHRKLDVGPLWPHEYVIREVFGAGSDIGDPILVDADDPTPDDEDRKVVDCRDDDLA